MRKLENNIIFENRADFIIQLTTEVRSDGVSHCLDQFNQDGIEELVRIDHGDGSDTQDWILENYSNVFYEFKTGRELIKLTKSEYEELASNYITAFNLTISILDGKV